MAPDTFDPLRKLVIEGAARGRSRGSKADMRELAVQDIDTCIGVSVSGFCNPCSNLISQVETQGGTVKKRSLLKMVCMVLVFCAATAIASLAQTLGTLYSFCSQANCTDGAYPLAGLIQATDGNFYGTAYAGGATGYGAAFKITPAGTLTTLHSFMYTDGASPYAGPVQGTDGNFYGTTVEGGTNSNGTVFKITPGGKLTTLYTSALK
jgi:uncharacterized repeat protein (TIGR03803 family)